MVQTLRRWASSTGVMGLVGGGRVGFAAVVVAEAAAAAGVSVVKVLRW